LTFSELFYPESRFGGYTDIDGSIAFYLRVNSLIDPSFDVLDVGCGRGADSEDGILVRKNLRNLRGKVKRVIGLDVDSTACDNPLLDEFRLIKNDVWPIGHDTIDLIICDNVLEHIDNPVAFFVEIRRVLKDGGLLCIRTPNRFSYVGIAAKLVPNRYHSKVLSFVQTDRLKEDVFPTVYKCNTIRMLKAIMENSNFDCTVYGYEAEPSYLSFSKIVYFLGVLHQRLAPGFLKPMIFAFGRIKK
jgi:SAM-dependent methyltransferase